jgi:hypothetical protein
MPPPQQVGQLVIPKTGDNLVLDTNQSVTDSDNQTFTGSADEGTDDVACNFGGLSVAAGFGGTQNFPTGVTFNGSSTIAGGTMKSGGANLAQTMTFDPGVNPAISVWLNHANFSGLNLTLNAGTDTTIDNGLIMKGDLTNIGSLTWSSGDIVLGGQLTNAGNGKIDIRCDNNLNDAGGSFLNMGSVTKSVGAGGNANTSIYVAFNNQSSLALKDGNLDFLSTAQQTAGGQNPVTVMMSGTQMYVTSSFDLKAGEFDGEGDFYGTFNNGDPAISGTNPILHPGSARGQAGTLTIHGSYKQASSATLYIEFTGPGAGLGFGLLKVTTTALGGGGDAALDGKVLVHRADGFSPKPGQFVYIQFASRTFPGGLSPAPTSDDVSRGEVSPARTAISRSGNSKNPF